MHKRDQALSDVNNWPACGPNVHPRFVLCGEVDHMSLNENGLKDLGLLDWYFCMCNPEKNSFRNRVVLQTVHNATVSKTGAVC